MKIYRCFSKKYVLFEGVYRNEEMFSVCILKKKINPENIAKVISNSLDAMLEIIDSKYFVNFVGVGKKKGNDLLFIELTHRESNELKDSCLNEEIMNEIINQNTEIFYPLKETHGTICSIYTNQNTGTIWIFGKVERKQNTQYLLELFVNILPYFNLVSPVRIIDKKIEKSDNSYLIEILLKIVESHSYFI